jgi:hypothetical protein
MRSAFRTVAQLIALGVVLQAAFVALGWFIILNDVDGGQVVDKAYLEDGDGWNIGHILHGIVGLMVMPLLGLVLLILSFFAKIPGAVKWAGLTLLAIVVQVALALIGFEAPALGALHGINAFILLGLASMAIRSARTDRAVATSTRHEAAAV